MAKLKDISIQKKLILIIFFIAFTTLIFVFTFSSIERYNFVKKELINQSRIQARLIGEYCISPLVFEDTTGVNEIIQKVDTLPFIMAIAVYNQDSKLIASYTKQGENCTFPENENHDLEMNKKRIHINEEITHKNQNYGNIHLNICTQKIRQDIFEMFKYFVFILTCMTIFIYFLAKNFQKIISTPILSLSNAAKEISQKKDYSVRINKTQNDEIGELFDSFNEMIKKIEERSEEKNHAIDNLRSQYERFLAILNSFPQAIYIVDPKNHKILFANESLEKEFNHPVVGKICYEEFQNGKVPCSFCKLKELKEENQAIEWEFFNKVLNKHFFIVDKLIRWTDGKIVKLEIALDITQRKIAEEKIIENEERMHNIIDQNPDAIIIIDAFNKIQFANKAAELLYSTEKENLIGDNFSIPFSIKKTIETSIKRNNQDDAYVEIRAIEFIWKNKPAYQIIHRDITKKVKDEKQRKSLEKQLQQSQKMESFGALAGGIAHDFNNILTVINGYSDLALSSLSEEDKYYSNFNEIFKAGMQASSLTRQLLAFSRKQVLDPKILNVSNLVNDLHKMLKRLIGEDLKLEIDLHSDLSLIKADPGQIEQVIMNLVINARDASIEVGSKIKIHGENRYLSKDDIINKKQMKSGMHVALSVEDSGTGMSKEVIDHIFEPFFTTKKIGSGTGLGLSVVFGIIKQHEGWINVQSEEGKGSVFTIYFPAIVNKSKETQTSKKEDLSKYKGNGENILLIEDEKTVRKIGVDLLSRFGYNVIETENATQARAAFENEENNFDLIISDVILPDESGVMVVKDFKKLKPDIKILLNSGYTANKINIEEIQKNKFKFIQKPYELHIFLKTIKNLMESAD